MKDFLNNPWVRGLVGLTGFFVGGVSLFFLLGVVIATASSGPESWIGGVVGSGVCLASTVFGAAMCWYAFNGLPVGDQGEGAEEPSLEDQLLEIARDNGGRITVALAAAETDLSLSEADEMLTRLAKRDLAKMEIEADGDDVYVFPGLEDDEAVRGENDWAMRLKEEGPSDETPPSEETNHPATADPESDAER